VGKMKGRNRLFEMLGMRLETFFERREECTSNGGQRIRNDTGNAPRMARDAFGRHGKYIWNFGGNALGQPWNEPKHMGFSPSAQEQADLREKQSADWRFGIRRKTPEGFLSADSLPVPTQTVPQGAVTWPKRGFMWPEADITGRKKGRYVDKWPLNGRMGAILWPSAAKWLEKSR
jgi:hypothetical protein